MKSNLNIYIMSSEKISKAKTTPSCIVFKQTFDKQDAIIQAGNTQTGKKRLWNLHVPYK